jgi:hypothetical protein
VLISLCLAASPGGQLVSGGSIAIALAAVVVHTLAMLVVTGAMAVLFYEWVAVAVLHRGWINLDRARRSGARKQGGGRRHLARQLHALRFAIGSLVAEEGLEPPTHGL